MRATKGNITHKLGIFSLGRAVKINKKYFSMIFPKNNISFREMENNKVMRNCYSYSFSMYVPREAIFLFFLFFIIKSDRKLAVSYIPNKEIPLHALAIIKFTFRTP